MTDELNPTQQDTDDSSTETQNQRKPVPYDRFAQVNEAKRIAEEKLAKYERDLQEKETATLAEQNKWKELYEKERAESEPLRGAKEEAKRLRERIEADNLADIELIPEDKRSLIPEYDDPIKMRAWLTANKAALGTPTRPIAPNLGGGAGGNVKQPDLKLSAYELEMAKAANMSPERYAAMKAQKGEAVTIESLKDK